MVLVAGESLMDMLPVSCVDGREAVVPTPGGSPFNVALALGRLGQRPQFLCGFSGDAYGRLLLDRLDSSGVDLSLCLELEGLTTLGFVTGASVGKAEYAFYTSGTAGCALGPGQMPMALPEDVEAIHFGSFSLGIEPFGSALEHLCEREASDRVISLDPNIRPFLIQDRDSYQARLDRLLGVADLVKLSDEDLEWMHPGKEMETFARELVDRGVGLVAITMGSRGAYVLNPNTAVRVEGVPIELADSVGAGDTFQAALLAGLSEMGLLSKSAIRGLGSGEIERLLKFAAKAAAITCSRHGCDPPMRTELGSL